LIDCAGAVNTVIRNCVLENAGDDAIDFDYAYDAVLSGNRISGCKDNAMSLGQAHGFQVYNNIITDCVNGIYAKEESEMSLYNNVLAFCGSALHLDSADPPIEVIIRNCAFQGNATHVDPDDQHTVDVQYCAFSGDAAYQGDGNISGDLLFLDVLNRDFRLRPTSPLIDAGWGTGNPEHDIRDSVRIDIAGVPNTGGGEIRYVDIGAYEYTLGDPEAPPPPISESYLFVDNYPNPFNAWTTIRFNIVRDGKAELVIYDRLGRRVFGTVWNNLTVGTYTSLWNAQTNSGTPLASGLYFVRLKQPAGSTTSRIILLR